MLPIDEISCITLSWGTAVLPLNPWMDVISMTDDSVRMKSAEGGELVVFQREGSFYVIAVEASVPVKMKTPGPGFTVIGGIFCINPP